MSSLSSECNKYIETEYRNNSLERLSRPNNKKRKGQALNADLDILEK
jgi:hypothetical protein